MEAAKEAISKLTSGHGKHTTDVTEHYKPAVTHEQINPTREHVDTTVVDNEVHQEHHHTSILPIKHKEVLPTEHHHNLAAAKHTEHHHGNHEGIHNKISTEAAQFKDHRETAPTEKTHSVAPVIAGEHHHHHVHETIQPVIQKQTIQPSVVHNTIPVHEVHHNEPKHYTASSLPAVTLDEFKKQGGALSGLADRTERFEGEPENIAQHGLHHGHGHGHHQSGHVGTGHNAGTTGETGTGSTGLTGSNTTGLGSSNSRGLNDNTRTGALDSTGNGYETSRAQQAIDGRTNKHGTNGSVTTGTGSNLTNTGSHSSTSSKPSLMQKLNPFKDTDGDGKKGIMD